MNEQTRAALAEIIDRVAASGAYHSDCFAPLDGDTLLALSNRGYKIHRLGPTHVRISWANATGDTGADIADTDNVADTDPLPYACDVRAVSDFANQCTGSLPAIQE